MAPPATKPHRRHRTTLPLDRELLARAQEALGTRSITETVESALRMAVGKPRTALGASGRPPIAHRIHDALDEEGFGTG